MWCFLLFFFFKIKNEDVSYRPAKTRRKGRAAKINLRTVGLGLVDLIMHDKDISLQNSTKTISPCLKNSVNVEDFSLFIVILILESLSLDKIVLSNF